MPNIFDRLLIRSFFSNLLICFLSLVGLYLIIDLFDNFDDFVTRNQGAGTLALIGKVAGYYGIQSVFLFDTVGIILSSISMVIVLLFLQRRRELHVILAAGVPTYRVTLPLLVCAGVVVAAHVANREFVIPKFAHEKFNARGEAKASGHPVQAIYDYASGIHIDGQSVYPTLGKLSNAKFILPVGRITEEMIVLKSEEAFFLKATEDHPAGWLLKNCKPTYADVPLNTQGKRFVRRVNINDDLFVVSDVSHDTLYKRGAGGVYLSTREMIERVRNPAFSYSSKNQFRFEIHHRLTEPLLSLILLFLTIPLIVRKKSRDLISNVGKWALVGGLLFGVTQAANSLGHYGILPPDFAAWIPVMISGVTATWWSFEIQT